ncbi:MAG: hypothetical protein ABI137_01445, partial [Antricoccus sp.]
ATPRGWRRASCCLLYRVGSAMPAPICGDCMFHRDYVVLETAFVGRVDDAHLRDAGSAGDV